MYTRGRSAADALLSIYFSVLNMIRSEQNSKVDTGPERLTKRGRKLGDLSHITKTECVKSRGGTYKNEFLMLY